MDIIEVLWPSSGPRHAVGHCIKSPEGELLYYGGEREQALLGGLFSKRLDPGEIFDDAAHLDGASATSPGARSHTVLAYHQATRSVYLFGGKTSSGFVSDLWRFDISSGQWTQLSNGSVEDAPPPMVAAGLLVSPIDGSVIVVAGTSSDVNERLWRYDGKLWHKITHWTD